MDTKPNALWVDWSPVGHKSTQVAMPDGRSLTIKIALPDGVPPKGGWPCLFLLDGERFFVPVAAAVQVLTERSAKTRVEPMVVVGVGHRAEDAPLSGQRSLDFTSGPAEEPGIAGGFGGAAALRDVLFHHIVPMVSAVAPIAADRATLFGHSLAGLFVLDTLAANPHGFARWISISPSLWWHTPDPAIATPNLLVACGALETRRDMHSRIANWCAAKPQGQGAQYLDVPRADHGSAPLALLPDILRWASFTSTAP